MLRMCYKMSFLLLFISFSATTSLALTCGSYQTHIPSYYYNSQNACSGGSMDYICESGDACDYDENLWFDAWVCPEACYYEVARVTLNAAPSEAVITGNTAVFTAQAFGNGPNEYLYEFSTNKYLNGQWMAWTTTRNYSSSRTWNWLAPYVTGSVYDQYNVAVDAMSFSKYNALGEFFTDSGSDYEVVDYNVVKRFSPYLSGSLLDFGLTGEEYYDFIDVLNGDNIGPYTWQITSGGLPPGLTFNAVTGEIEGTPTQAGTYSFIVRVTDGFNLYTESRQFIIRVVSPLSITISTDNGIINTPYSETSTTSGGLSPYRWSVYSGSLPPGLTINSSTGAISGTPTTAGSYTFEVELLHEEDYTENGITYHPSISWNADYAIDIYPPLAITTTTLPEAMDYLSYTAPPLTVIGGEPPYHWYNVNSGIYTTYILDGVSLDPETGIISGTPNGWNESFPVTIAVFDSLNKTATKNLTFVVHPPIQISANFSNGFDNTVYSRTLTATGGFPGGYTWSMASGTLPTGLSLGSDGAVSGLLQSPGIFTFTVQAVCKENLAATATQQYSIQVYSLMTISPNSLIDGKPGLVYGQALTATGGLGWGYCWSLYSGSLPPGLTFSPGGIISGTPQTAGHYDFAVQVGSMCQYPASTSIKTYTIDIYSPLQIVTSSPLLAGAAGIPYNQTLTATGGKPGYSWSIVSGNLPVGLNLDPASGAIVGTAYDVGSFTVTVQVSDAQGLPATASTTYTLYVTNGPMQHSAENSTVVGCSASKYATTGSTTDVISGSLTHDQELFSVKGGVFGIAITLFYKSLPDYNGPLGPGWSHNYDIFLTVNRDGSVVLQDGSGSKSFYTKGGTSYIPPPGDFSTLIKKDNSAYTYTVAYRDGHSYNFNASGKISAIIDRFGNTTTINYLTTGSMTITDPANRTATIAFDQSVTPHRITAITDPNGQTYDFSYQGTNCSNMLCRVTNPAAIGVARGYWEYQYQNGYLKSKRDPNSNSTQYTYYADHRMQSAIDPDGISSPTGHSRIVTYPTTTTNSRTTTITEKDNGLWQYTYDANNGVLTGKTNPDGKTINYYYYPNGFFKAKTEPKNDAVRLTTFYSYDSYGNVLIETEPADLSTYSPAIAPNSVTDPTSLALLNPPIKAARRYTYDNNNDDMVTSIADERVAPTLTTTYVYTTENGGEVVTATTTPGNFVTVTKKNTDGTVRQVIDANKKFSTFTYYPNTQINKDAGTVGLLWTTTDPAGITTTVNSYDKNGNPSDFKVTGNNGVATPVANTMLYDNLNRLTTATRRSIKTTPAFADIVTTSDYDYAGNLTSILDAEQHQTSYQYNYNRQVTKITDAKLNDTVFNYSGSGCGACGAGVDKLIGVYDANITKNTPLESQPHTAYQYDLVGRLDYETDQIGKKFHYTYDDNGLVKEKLDATNSIPGTLLFNFVYNNRGQVTDKIFTDGAYEHYSYKPNGQLDTAANQNIGYTYTYYDNGRLHTVTDTTNNRQISYDQYDGLGQRKQVTVMKGAGADERVIIYDYDNANRSWHITSNAGTFTYNYDNLGRRWTIGYPNQATATYLYDDLNRLTSLTHTFANSTIASYSYPLYDLMNNRKSVSGSRNETYDYDELYRLLAVTSDKPESFAYDAMGNRQSGPTTADSAYRYNAANQMIQGLRLAYGYDNAGNQKSKTVSFAADKTWTRTWDYNNRLTQEQKVKGTETKTITYKYDPFGRRIEKKFVQVVGAATEIQTSTYLYDNENIVLEMFTTSSGTEKSFFTHGAGIDEPLALERSGNSNYYYYHADGLGSIVSITDDSRNVVQSYDYSSYGLATASSDFRNSYQFTAREYDWETGTYFYRARYYDPIDGAFISKDPIGFAGGINIYAYSENNPTNFLDPSGMATYQINRELGGNQLRSTWNPLSHTFIAVTDVNGRVKATYSWGNIYAKDRFMMTKWAPANLPDDVLAATRAISTNNAYMISDGFLDKYVTKAYNELSYSDYERWSPFNSCKHKGINLIDRALELSQQ